MTVVNRTKIEWADYTWNPVVGCENNCWYCYAQKMNDRFKFVEDFGRPEYFPERVTGFKAPPLPRKRNRIAQLISPDKVVVFVCSMGDVFGCGFNAFVAVFRVIKNNPEVNFMLLTKEPKRYIGWEIPNNCYLGYTVCGGKDFEDTYDDNLKIMEDLATKQNWLAGGFKKTFISAEPLLGDCSRLDFSFAEFVIAGPVTGEPKHKPSAIDLIDWGQSIRHPKVYFKDSYYKIIGEEIR